MEEKKKELLKLVHQKDIFKIIIPEEVERKIRFLCKNIWTVEWSGVLFYKFEGSFEDKSLTIRCVDILQMDEGSAGYTEFNMSADVVSYMIDHPELMGADVYQGLIHSHNNMSTFFSGTDTATLLSEGSDMAHFVSLIVNNAGSYSAGITRKYKCVQEVKEVFSYGSWNDKTIVGEDKFSLEEEVIEWFNLNIEFEKTTSSFEEETLARIADIRKEKEESKKKAYSTFNGRANYYPTRTPSYTGGGSDKYPSRMYDEDYYDRTYPTLKGYSNDKVPQSFASTVPAGKGNLQLSNKSEMTELPFEDEGSEFINIPYGEMQINPNIIQSLVKQIVTASIIIPNESTIDINKWALSMNSVYGKRFKTIKEFENFAASYIDFLVTTTEDPAYVKVLDVSEITALIAYDLSVILEKLPTNPWLKCYLSLLYDYIL